MHRLWLQLFIFAQISTTLICGESYCTVIAPGTIRSNRKYSVGVTLHAAREPATIRIAIISPTSSLNLTQDVTLQPLESKLIDFMPPKLLDQYNYMLRAEGVRGIELNKTSFLYAISYGGPRIYLETDRGTYKPGDTVQFRVIILDEHLRPTNIVEPIRVQILDADRNRVKHFKDIQLKRGVFAASFPLSQQPISGQWIISVFLSGKYNMERQFRFEVDKYVLPKFSVHIETEPDFVETDRFIKATVYAKYTYGEYVEGTAVFSAMDAVTKILDRAPKPMVVIANGALKSEVLLDVADLKHAWKIDISVTFKELLTNVTATTNRIISVRHQHYKIIVPDSDIEFRNEQPYRLKVHVQHWNGTAVKDSTKPVSLIIKDKKYESHLNSDGVAEFEFEYDPSSDFSISYDDSTHRMGNIYAPRTSNEEELQTCTIKMKGLSSTDLKSPLEFEVFSNVTIPYLVYVLTSHGNILSEEYIQVPPNQKSQKIKLDTSIAIVPQSYLYVHYIVGDKLQFCEFTIRLPHTFENQISLMAPTLVSPGQEITMDIKGQPNSHVSIVAVDKRALLLNSRNVLKKSDIMKDLLFDRSYQHKEGTLRYPGYVSGLITITNAKYDIRETYPYMEPIPANDYEEYPRSIFPETWIFEDIEIDGDNTSLKLKVPDTITTWIVRAFSVNDHSGFGMLDSTLDIKAFKPFFISTTLPYAVKRGEVITIPVLIFNYLEQNFETEIILDNAKEEFTVMDNNNFGPSSKLKDTRFVNIPANNGKSVAFVIKPKKVGDIDLRITAKNRETSDTIIEKLKVEPEGLKKQYNQDRSLNLRQGKSEKAIFYAQIPTDIVPESEYVRLSVSGDIMVSTLENLEDLVRKPTGCGEQNMINLAPNILVLDYLKALNMLRNLTGLVAKAKQHIDTGYQQELTYRHPEGGYSVFGPSGGSTESNWLTAYVIRFFIKGLKHSAIEPRIIESGLEYLAKQQSENGSFPQRGYLFHPSHQSEYGFTAFVLLAYLEDPKYSKKHSKVIENGMQFLTTNLNSIQDAYSLAIVANVFQATANAHTNEVLGKLKKLAHEENGLMWWSQKSKKKESANSVEITSYALMAFLEVSGSYSSVFNWLIKQRNSQGGFGSTQDTVVGLQALIKFAEKSPQASSDVTQLKLSYVAKDSNGKNVKEDFLEVDTENQFVLQQQELPQSTRSVDVQVLGQGKMFLQFSYQYYVSTDGRQMRTKQRIPALHFHDFGHEMALPNPASEPLVVEHQYFDIKPVAKLSANSKILTLAICYSYQPPPEADEFLTNMVILQAQLPSSFVSNNENIEQLKEEEQISRVELMNSATMLAIYFEKLEANNEQCLTIVGDKMHEVASLKPSAIEMYDYYNPKERSEVLYEINNQIS